MLGGVCEGDDPCCSWLPDSYGDRLNVEHLRHRNTARSSRGVYKRVIYFSRSLSPKTRVNPKLQVSRIASGGNALPWTILDAARIGSLTPPNTNDAARCTVRTLFA